jgi:hypothetical protein
MLSCRGKSGSFPKNFVEPLKLPSLQPHERVFAAIKDFNTHVDGDLVFNQGWF